MPEITNMGFIDKHGEHITRCWNTSFPEGSRMYEVPTRKDDIKPLPANYCYEPGAPDDERRGHRGRPGTKEGT